MLLSLLAVALTLTHQLTTYGKVHSQSRREVRRNGLMQPLGTGLVFGKFGKPHKTGRFVSSSYNRFPHALVAAPTQSGKGDLAAWLEPTLHARSKPPGNFHSLRDTTSSRWRTA